MGPDPNHPNARASTHTASLLLNPSLLRRFVFREGRTKGIGVVVATQGDSPDTWDDVMLAAQAAAPGANGPGAAGCGAEVAAAGGGAAAAAGCRVGAP